MVSTEKSRQFWHQTAVRAQTVAASARAVLDYPRSETQAINDVQLLLDQFWRMGFRATNAIAVKKSREHQAHVNRCPPIAMIHMNGFSGASTSSAPGG